MFTLNKKGSHSRSRFRTLRLSVLLIAFLWQSSVTADDCTSEANRTGLLNLISATKKSSLHDFDTRVLMDQYLNDYPDQARALYKELIGTRFEKELGEVYAHRGGDRLDLLSKDKIDVPLKKSSSGGTEGLKIFSKANPGVEVLLRTADGKPLGPGLLRVDSAGNGILTVDGKKISVPGSQVVSVLPLPKYLVIKPIVDVNPVRPQPLPPKEYELPRITPASTDTASYVSIDFQGRRIPVKILDISTISDGTRIITLVRADGPPIKMTEAAFNASNGKISSAANDPNHQKILLAADKDAANTAIRNEKSEIIDTSGKVVRANSSVEITDVTTLKQSTLRVQSFNESGITFAGGKMMSWKDYYGAGGKLSQVQENKYQYDSRLFKKLSPVLLKGKDGKYIQAMVSGVDSKGNLTVMFMDPVTGSALNRTITADEISASVKPFTLQVDLDLSPGGRVKIYRQEYKGWVFGNVSGVKDDGSLIISYKSGQKVVSAKILPDDIDSLIRPDGKALGVTPPVFTLKNGKKVVSQSDQLVDVYPWGSFQPRIRTEESYVKIMNGALNDLDQNFPLTDATKARLKTDESFRERFFSEIFTPMNKVNDKAKGELYGNERSRLVDEDKGVFTVCALGAGVCLETSIYYHAILTEYGIRSELQTGTKQKQGHAWVYIPEYDRVINANWNSGERAIYTKKQFEEKEGWNVVSSMPIFAPTQRTPTNEARAP
ncbi:MAG TPA: hypothetical protein VNJ01_06485 [Bacteriovoracaceae bacterium]|nr:hypothetical protein [Bacteriovoracaceae bacterium]